jgi:hypothetical protein
LSSASNNYWSSKEGISGRYTMEALKRWFERREARQLCEFYEAVLTLSSFSFAGGWGEAGSLLSSAFAFVSRFNFK